MSDVVTFRGGPLDGKTLNKPFVGDVQYGEVVYMLRGDDLVLSEQFWADRKAAAEKEDKEAAEVTKTVTIYKAKEVRIRMVCKNAAMEKAIANPEDLDEAIIALNAEEMAKRIATGLEDQHMEGLKAFLT